MTTAQIAIVTTMVVYLLGMISVGFFYSGSGGENSTDFYLGGRKLGPIVTAMSAEASDMSSWLLMGLPGVAYFTGLADATWTAVGLALGTYLNWLLVSKRLRLYSAEINAITVPGFIAARFKDESGLLRGIAAAIIIIFFVPYTASGFAAVGKLFNSLFGFDYVTSMMVGAAVIIIYTILGGFMAVSITDLIQSIVMTIALIVIFAFGVNVAGGWDHVVANAISIPGYLRLTELGNISTRESSPYGFISIVSTMAWGLGYFGMPHILLRFMGINDAEKLKLSRRIATIWVVISMGVAVTIGMVGYAASTTGSIELFTSSSAAEAVVIRLANLLSAHGILAATIAGLVLSGILACTMSTADSQLLAASSSVSEDILVGVFKMRLSQNATMWVAKVAVIMISLIAVLFARNPDSSVFTIVSFAWAGFGATFAPVILTALFWPRTNKWGAISGMLAGAVMVFAWKYLVRPLGGAWNIYELLPAFIVSFICIVVVSLLTEKPDKEMLKIFRTVDKKMR